MAVYVSNLVINTGTTFSQTFTLESADNNSVLDLAGYNVHAHIRKHASSSSKTEFDTTIVSVDGKIKLDLSDDKTALLSPGRHVYDVVITSGGGVKTTVVEGSVLVREGVTR